MDAPVLILGQGFAGTTLALRLAMEGVPFRLVSHPDLPGASRKAVGLVNPVTGRRMAKTRAFESLFGEAISFYRKAFRFLEPESLRESFLEPYPIWKALHSVEEINFLTAKSASPGFEGLISIWSTQEAAKPVLFKDTIGWCRIEHGFLLEPAEFLDAAAKWMGTNGLLDVSHFSREDLRFDGNRWFWKDAPYRAVVTCLGLACPWIGPELKALKGEVYEVSGMQSWGKHILKTEKFAIPLPDGNVRMGSTYNFDVGNESPTTEGLDEILGDLLPEIRLGLNIERGWAGFRPTTHDRIPIVREISPRLFAINGLGTKGISIAPSASLTLLNRLKELSAL